MARLIESASSYKPRLEKGKLQSVWQWLLRPLKTSSPGTSRRARLLAWLLASLLILTVATIILVQIINVVNNSKDLTYTLLILGLNIFVVLAYILNCAGYYTVAASLAVTCALLGPWGSLVLDPTILKGDFVPLAFTTLPILLSSLLLSPLFTIILAGSQFVALLMFPIFYPATASINWASFLSLIFFISVLSILSSSISQSDLRQIDRQTRELSLSEAKMRELSIRDHLTNLFNRRYLEEILELEIWRSLRSGYTIGILMFDIDHFKQFNDQWGHAAGDAVLTKIGQLVLSSFRKGDVACRYGGEEFVILLPEASLKMTLERAEMFREKVKNTRVVFDSKELGEITISIGVAVYPDHGSTKEEMLKSADDALYRAKSEGRDRVNAAG